MTFGETAYGGSAAAAMDSASDSSSSVPTGFIVAGIIFGFLLIFVGIIGTIRAVKRRIDKDGEPADRTCKSTISKLI
jgi:hypothetical protein